MFYLLKMVIQRFESSADKCLLVISGEIGIYCFFYLSLTNFVRLTGLVFVVELPPSRAFLEPLGLWISKDFRDQIPCKQCLFMAEFTSPKLQFFDSLLQFFSSLFS
jgi:hypothetical protein